MPGLLAAPVPAFSFPLTFFVQLLDVLSFFALAQLFPFLLAAASAIPVPAQLAASAFPVPSQLAVSAFPVPAQPALFVSVVLFLLVAFAAARYAARSQRNGSGDCEGDALGW